MLPILISLQLLIMPRGPQLVDSDLHAYVVAWQERLQLEDWSITLAIVPREVLDEKAQADIEPQSDKSAILRIMRTEDSDLDQRLALADQEVSIVHELVHLKYFAHPGAVSWSDEGAVISETCMLLRRFHRRLAFKVCECRGRP
jgi:hypothetical protein